MHDTDAVVVRLPYAGLRAAAGDLRARLAHGQDVVLELGPPGAVDLPLLDVLARLRLDARRGSGSLCVRADGLAALADLVGLRTLLLGQAQRQAEPHEQLVAEEVVDVRDPTP